MKMSLLHDILKGLEALEHQEKEQVVQPKPKSTGRLVSVSRGPAGEPVSEDPYAVDYPPQSYEYDPDGIVFFSVELGSPEHQAKLKDFHRISSCDPSTAHKILTLG